VHKYQLKLDIDQKKLPEEELVQRLFFMHQILRIYTVMLDKRKTKNGWHIRITVTCKRKLTDRDIVFLQLFCLSDYKREGFNLMRVWNRWKNWNILFAGKTNSKGEIISREVKK
jgi:hypothetical protein